MQKLQASVTSAILQTVLCLLGGFFQVASAIAGDEPAALRGSITDDVGATAAGVTFGIGYTTNAGPVLSKPPSSFVDAGMAVLHKRVIGGNEATFELAISDREFTQRNDIKLFQYKAQASISGKLATEGQIKTTFGSERPVEPEEDVTQTGVTIQYENPAARLSPLVSVAAYYLDYADIPTLFLEGGNQDDRDRFSTVAQVGLRYRISDAFAVRFGAGTDRKHYVVQKDDFGFMRDSVSYFPFLGAGYASKAIAAEFLYAPVYRTYSDPSFTPLLAHTLTARGEYEINASSKAFVVVRRGLEETDFPPAKSIIEVAVGGGVTVTTTGGSSVTAEIFHTERDFLGFDRMDRKIETTLRGKTPIGNDIYLTAELRYLDFRTSYLDINTDMFLAMVGIAYTYSK